MDGRAHFVFLQVSGERIPCNFLAVFGNLFGVNPEKTFNVTVGELCPNIRCTLRTTCGLFNRSGEKTFDAGPALSLDLDLSLDLTSPASTVHKFGFVG